MFQERQKENTGILFGITSIHHFHTKYTQRYLKSRDATISQTSQQDPIQKHKKPPPSKQNHNNPIQKSSQIHQVQIKQQSDSESIRSILSKQPFESYTTSSKSNIFNKITRVLFRIARINNFRTNHKHPIQNHKSPQFFTKSKESDSKKESTFSFCLLSVQDACLG